MNSENTSVWAMEERHLMAWRRKVAAVKKWPTARQVAAARDGLFGGIRASIGSSSLRSACGPRGGRVVVFPIQGGVEEKFTPEIYFFGGFATEYGEAFIEAAMADDSISTIVLDIDSPGGTVYSTPEFADTIYNASKKKTVIAIANSMAASAAFYIASQ